MQILGRGHLNQLPRPCLSMPRLVHGQYKVVLFLKKGQSNTFKLENKVVEVSYQEYLTNIKKLDQLPTLC
jgi:hypothetical protein